MEKVFLREGESYIKLGQALKKAGIAPSGAEAAAMIGAGHVLVNGETELRRGRKLTDKDVIEINGEKITISK